MRLSRRGALGLIGAGAALPAVAAARASTKVSFDHGVASGDPTTAGAVLWTRATPATAGHAAPIGLKWMVAAQPDGAPLAKGRVEARPARDFTAKVDVKGLKAGETYHYWFEAEDGTRSPTGRFRTLPKGKVADVVLAVATCQLHPGGLFNAYDAIAREERLDAVLHLGDYIYEYGPDGYGGDIGRKLGRIPEPPHEIVTLADYRTRHAQYKRDPDLQAAHARAAFICVWDDHETANDSWMDGAQNHQPETEGDWKARKAAAIQAYFEWMPIRDAAPGKPWEAINRRFAFGDLADLLMVETRLLARSEQPDLGDQDPTPEMFAALELQRKLPEREMLGEPQRAWLSAELKRSVKAGTPWQIIGNQVLMARLAGPQLDRIAGPEKTAAMVGGLSPDMQKRVQTALMSYRAGVPYNTDSWDGYPAARERLYATFRDSGAMPIVLAGDSHAFWANNLHDDSGRLVATEFGATAISSPSEGDSLVPIPLGDLLETVNEEVVFCDQRAKGYIRLTLTPDRTRSEFVAVSTIFAKPYEAKTLASFEVAPGAARKTLSRG